MATGPAPTFFLLWRNWFVSHLVGMVLFGTVTLVACLAGRDILGRSGQRLELALNLALLGLLTIAVFAHDSFSLPFLIYPPLLLMVFRHRFVGFALGTTIVAVIAIAATVTGHGPFMRVPDGADAMRTLWLQGFICFTCLFALPVAVVVTQGRALTRRLAMSERDHRLLAENVQDIVMRIAPDGTRKYVSPSAEEILGWSPEELRETHWERIHPDDVERLARSREELRRRGGANTITYRVQHKDGHYVWIEAHSRLIPAMHHGDAEDIVYVGRDVSARVLAERALQDNQRRLRAITDNMPAFVLHVDKDERYTFANDFAFRELGIEPSALIGHTVREVMGEVVHNEISPYMQAAFAGRHVSFEIERVFRGELRDFQSIYVPDVGENGAINGFYSLTFEITSLKRTQAELLRQTRRDALTGIANRRRFIERLELAVARSRRSQRPVALLYLDVDRFKKINDTFGHAAGDCVLREFARRLTESVRDVDLVARMGGDEFVVVIEDIDSVAAAEAIADKLVTCLREPIAVDDHNSVRTSASIGIAFSAHPVDDPETLVSKADAALYEAKRAGRDVWRRAG
jgi:diguanylate cyclase (GGDEF)-like protein/PAS domain S-box-containing protein